MNILVTGGSGLLGHALQKIMPDAIYISSKDVDLRCREDVTSFFNRCGDMDVVIHASALVNGIYDNAVRQYEYFYDNVTMNTNVVHECVKRFVPRVIAMSSSCVYPKHDTSRFYPLIEDQSDHGMPEGTNLTYAYAKRMMAVQLRAAAQQYGLCSVVLYASNMYGPYDCFDPSKSHLVAALIHRFHNAIKNGTTTVQLWGTGQPLRQFTYVDDVASVIRDIVYNHKNLKGEFNISTRDNLSVSHIAETIADVLGYEGSITFNGKLDGQFRKDICIDKICQSIGDIEFTDLSRGVKKTYEWYKEMEFDE